MSDFIPARKFNQLASKGDMVISSSGRWHPAFKHEKDAAEFARYVGGYPQRVIARATTHAFTNWSPKHNAFCANLGIHFPGWGHEEGRVICQGDQAMGILIKHQDRFVLLPIQQHCFCARTESGSLYVRFEDGSAFCRSRSDGPQPVAKTLFFTRSSTNAGLVMDHGGELDVTDIATRGFYPVYVRGDAAATPTKGRVWFAKRAFRLGTTVKEVSPA